MGSGCFRGSASQVHPVPQGVLPTDSGNGMAVLVAPVPQSVPAVSSTKSPTAQPSQAPDLALSIQQPLQVPAVLASEPVRPKPKPSLVKAVKDGNAALVDELLREGCDIEKPGMWENTPLVAACYYGRGDTALKLIGLKANVHAKNEHGATALHYAAAEGSFGVVEALLAAARIDGKEGGSGSVLALVNCGSAHIYNRHLDAYARRTPLCCASESGFSDMVSALLAAGAVLDERSEEDRTALWLACRHSRLSVAKLLLQAGALADAKDAHGISVLGAALVSCNEQLVLALLSHGVRDVNDTAGLVLQDAIKAGKRAIVEALLTHGAFVQPMKDDAPTTPLHMACEKGDEYLVSLLVRARADPSKVNSAGQTSFDVLRKRGLPDGHIKSLLAAPDVMSDGGTGTTADVGVAEQTCCNDGIACSLSLSRDVL